MSFTASQYLKDLSNEISCDIYKSDFWILYHERSQHVEDLHNSVNRDFPNDQGML